MPRPLNTLIVDVETAPTETRSWHPKAYSGHRMVTKVPIIITWAAKWRGSNKVFSDKLTPLEVNSRDDSVLVENLAKLLREADVVVAHNVDKFDLPKINGRLAHWELEPLAPVRTVDTLKIAQKKLGYPHNNLDYLAKWWGYGRKLQVHWELWEEILDGPDQEGALRKMERYNRQDVKVLDPIFERVIRYTDGVARLYTASYQDEMFCHYCGGTELEKRGTRQTQAGTFQRYRCLNPECGKYDRGRTSMGHVKSALVPI